MTTRGGIFTPPSSFPKASSERNRGAMEGVLGQVTSACTQYDKLVDRARMTQARLVVDALYERYSRQVKNGNTTLSFGEWLLYKHRFTATYAKLGPEAVLWNFGGILHETRTDKRYRYFAQQSVSTDWLTGLIERLINERVKEKNFVVRVTEYTVPFVGFKEALPSLNFERDWVPGAHAA